MADKSITDLNVVPGSIDDSNTWFAVAQSGAAYKVSGHEFILALTVILDGHGGIKEITGPVSVGLVDTYTITFADDTTTTFDVENGKGITGIAKTGTAGLVDTYTISYNDGTSTTFNVTNGAKGDTGDSWYVWIKYSGSQPTQDSDMGDDPDNWMGIYSGTSSTAPTHYTDYNWFQIKGAKGDTGAAATVSSTSVTYQESQSGTVAPSGSWSSTVPSVSQGNYLWTRTVIQFNSGSPITLYSVARMGVDGTGSVVSVNNQSPDGTGNVTLTASDIGTSDATSVQADLTQLKNTLTQLDTETATIEQSIAIIINGNTSSSNVSKGQYVYLKNSTITGKADGLYIYNGTTKTAGNAFLASELTDTPAGGFNSLLNSISLYNGRIANEEISYTLGAGQYLVVMSGVSSGGEYGIKMFVFTNMFNGSSFNYVADAGGNASWLTCSTSANVLTLKSTSENPARFSIVSLSIGTL